MNCILLICETKEDAEYLIKIADILPDPLKEIDILSTLPEIKSIFENHDIPSVTSSYFINRKDYEIINSDCMKIYSALEINVKKIITFRCSECLVNMFLYYTFFAFYTIFWNARLLHNILALGKYSKFITFTPQKNINKSPWYVPKQNILHLLFSRVITDKSIEHVILKRSEVVKFDFTSNFLLFTLRKLLYPVYSLLLRRIFIRDKKTYKIMVPTLGKNMNLLCAELIKKYPRICFFVLGEGKSVLSELYMFFILLKYIFTKKGYNDHNLPEGLVVKLSLSLLNPFGEVEKQGFSTDYFSKIMLRIQESKLKLNILNSKEVVRFFQLNKIEHIFSYLQYQQSLSSGLEKCLEFLKPDMIFSQMSLGVTCMLGNLAEIAGIPSMLISHGSHVLHTDGVAKLEHELIANNMLVGGYRFLGIQTSHSGDYVAKKKIPNQSIVKINPIILSGNISKNKFKDSKLTVLHAGTIKDGTKRFIYETPDELLETFQETIEILSTCQNIKLIIKFRQTEAFSYNSLKMLLDPLPDNVSLVSEGSFGDFLALSHLLMSFSSTTIEEALINDTPVLLYGGKGRYSHIPTEPFKLVAENSIMTPVTFVDNKISLNDYFKTLNNNHVQFIENSFNFDHYRLKDSMDVLDWIEQNSILEKT